MPARKDGQEFRRQGRGVAENVEPHAHVGGANADLDIEPIKGGGIDRIVFDEPIAGEVHPGVRIFFVLGGTVASHERRLPIEALHASEPFDVMHRVRRPVHDGAVGLWRIAHAERKNVLCRGVSIFEDRWRVRYRRGFFEYNARAVAVIEKQFAPSGRIVAGLHRGFYLFEAGMIEI